MPKVEKKEKEEKKPKKPKSIPPFALTGVWEGEGESGRLRLQLLQEGEVITGRLRSDAVSEEVVDLTGTRVEHGLAMSGLAPEGVIELEGSTVESNTDGISFTHARPIVYLPDVAGAAPKPSDSTRLITRSHSAAEKSGARETKICSAAGTKASGQSFEGNAPIGYAFIGGGS